MKEDSVMTVSETVAVNRKASDVSRSKGKEEQGNTPSR